MKPSETIIFSDLDATLFGSDGHVSRENREAISRYMDEGGLFAVATGREPSNAMRFLADVPMNAPSVVLNGSAVCDLRTGALPYEVFLDRAALEPYLRRALAEIPRLELQAYTREGICYCTPEETAQPQLLRLHKPCIFTTLDALAGTPFYKCFLYVEPEWEDTLAALLAEIEARGVARHVPGTTDVGGIVTYHELLPVGASKGSALRFLRGQPGIRGRTVLAAGDYWNDYELLREADVAVAPSNAIPEIKALCRYVTVSNNEHVVKHIIEDIIPVL